MQYLILTVLIDNIFVQNVIFNIFLIKKSNHIFFSWLYHINSTTMSDSQHSCESKTTIYVKYLLTKLQSMITCTCYNSDEILTSGKTIKKEVLYDLLCNLYMLLLEDK